MAIYKLVFIISRLICLESIYKWIINKCIVLVDRSNERIKIISNIYKKFINMSKT